MALSRHKIGSFVELYNATCDIPNLTVWDVSGINRDKEFFEPSKQVGADTSKYKIVPNNYFACNLMHVGRDVVLPVALNHSGKNKYVSPAYAVFKVKDNSPIMKEYLFMLLKSEEKDRYFWFQTDSSVRDGMSWGDFCDVEVELPSLDIQKKYVNIYNSLLSNQQCYESGLQDLRMICDIHFDEEKHGKNMKRLGEIVEQEDVKNIELIFGESDVRGITNKKEFDRTKADVKGKDLSKFLVIKPGVFAYNSRTDGRDMLVLALNRGKKEVIVTWNYNAFKIKDAMKNMVNPEYLYAFFKRDEFDRRVRFNSWGSTQELLSWDSLCDIQIPVPEKKKQDAIAEINNLHIQRRDINEKLKTAIVNICPILIKGAIEEASV